MVYEPFPKQLKKQETSRYGNNVTTTYAYADPESRLTDITYPAGTIGAVHYAYDGYGRCSQMTDGTGGQTYAYDDDALTTKNVTWTGFPAKTITYGFYPDGSRRRMTADGRAFSYGYDGRHPHFSRRIAGFLSSFPRRPALA